MPSSDISLVSENMKMFHYWMYERQNIWYKRFALKENQPWTEDKILREYKFTNVYRDLDRNTQWLINNVINKEKNNFEVFWKIVVFRYFNLPELFEYIGSIPDYSKYKELIFNKKIIEYKEKFGRVFTKAYMIHPPRSKEDRKLGLELFYCKNIKQFHNKAKNMWNRYLNMKNPEDFHLMMKELMSIADFMAYEIYCDLCYTDWFKWNENDFVNVGPGAKFGLEILFPSLLNIKTYNSYLKKLIFLKDKADVFFRLYNFMDFKYYNKNNLKKYKIGKHLTLRSIEHSLCEYSKYYKMRLNVGKPRQKFEPKTLIK